MAYPEHQPIWYKVATGFGLLGLAMISTAAVLGSSKAHLDFTGLFMILAYVAFALAVTCFTARHPPSEVPSCCGTA